MELPGPAKTADLRIGEENFLDRFVEDLAEFVGQREAGGIFFRLEGDDSLASDTDAVSQFGLRPVEFSAKHAKAVFHWLRHVNL